MKMNLVMGAAVLSWVLCGCQTQTPPGLGEPLADLSPAQRAEFERGREVFRRVFEPRNGLGPLFNANSCAECHEDPVVGGSGDEIEVHAALFSPTKTCDLLFQEGGPVIQQDATPLLKAKGIAKEQLPPSATAQALRSSPALFGLGLVDAIPDDTILAQADPDDADRDGIRGRANRTIDGRIGRFGRKAVVATLLDFNTGAFPLEMGITTPLSPVEETINGTPVSADTDPVPEPEISLEDIESMNAYVRFLAPPAPLIFSTREEQVLAQRGQALFAELKCAVCHVPKMTTGPNPIAALDRKPVQLYSDLLVHDMGEALADICMEQAGPADFRTEFLMGLRFRTQFLHDGSASTVEEAIERHGGEALGAREKYKTMNEADRKALLKFLESL